MPATNLLLASKVVVVESPPTTQTVTGVPTAIAAFIGLAARGPIATPTFITSFAQFVSTFGSYNANSNLAMSVQGFFDNGGTQAWVSRTAHFTDVTNPSSVTADEGMITLPDRGGAAAPAILTSGPEPFALAPNQHLNFTIDASANQLITFTATPAIQTTAAQTFVLADLETFQYKVKLPGSSAFDVLRTITFHTADFANIAAATAAEVDFVIGRDGKGINAKTNANTVVISTDKQGSGASFQIVGGTAVTPLGLTVGTTNGTGNVADIDYVLAAEVATILTALPLLPNGATGTAAAGKASITGVTTGVVGQVTILNTTTALGIFAGNLPITVNGTNSAILNTLTVEGKDPGTWIKSYKVVVSAATSGDAARFNLAIIEVATGNGETWANLSMTATDARYVQTFVNANSTLVVVTDLLDVTAPPSNMPATGTYTNWVGSNDGLTNLADSDFTGNSAGRTGLNSFDLIDNITLLSSPDRATSAMHNAMVTYCDVGRQRAAFAILDPPANDSATQINTYVVTTAGLFELSECAAIYWPRIFITNPSTAVFGTGNTITVPPSGHLAGVYSRADSSKPGGVYEAPAGLLNNYGTIFGAVGLETDQVNDEAVRDLLAPNRINPICRIDGSPIHADGHFNLKDTGDFPSIPERRGASFIESSLKKGTQFAKHRNNDRRLRMTVKTTIEAFLLRQFENGAFRGATPNESFYVDVSDKLNPEEVIFAGQLNAKIGLATQKPTQWVVLDFTQDTRALDARLAQIASSTSTNAGA